MKDLQRAVALTSKKRDSEIFLKNAEEILAEIQDSDSMKKFWEKYRKENLYAKDVSFDIVMECVRKIKAMLQ